ncbi:hypothetical protein CTAM01_01832 [Colletotrichum tamarilloi]|uniref:Fungal N-terminal domain-containing protein n=1 Tax=Colletotrichum tamarilloi TaxID=1209934 RepID=A0ABQ9RQD5_9PEZI|nr:uncharacterized protein CTAM01_01832 [Colletotrichum tamarilloi]KAK1509709.1 hypothetical protein CTAM01_01832 [Colletotrichum tamarilloi]
MEAAIGVIGLSLQLIDSAIKVKRVVTAYRSASAEINRLALKIERVEVICGAIKDSLEGDASSRQCSDLIKTWGVCVLRSISSTLAEIHTIITKLERKGGKRRPLNTVGFTFLECKDDISRLSKWLDDDLNYLQHMMTAEILCNIVQQLTIHHNEASELSNMCSTLTQSTLQRDHNGDLPSEPRHTTMAKTGNQMTIKAFGFRFQTQTRTILKRSSSHGVQEVSNTSEIKTYTFGHSKFSYRIELHWSMSTLTPIVCALAVRHVLSEDKDEKLVRKILIIMCDGDLLALQDLLSTRSITLGTMLGDRTLFESAAVCGQPSLCRFLAQQNLDLCQDEKVIRRYHLLEPSDALGRVFEVDEIVQLTQRSRPTRFRLMASGVEDVESLVAVYRRCRLPALHEMEKKGFFDAVWDIAVQLLVLQAQKNPFWCREDRRTKDWTRLFVELIDEGVDVHRICKHQTHYAFRSFQRHATVLSLLLRSSPCHYAVEAALSHWVRILLVAGVDVARYLQSEEPNLQQYIDWQPPFNRARVWVTVAGTTKIAGFEIPLLHRYVGPYSKANEVRNEFKNFGELLKEAIWPDLGDLMTIEHTHCQQHVLWKSCRLSESDKREWPFVFNFLRDYDSDALFFNLNGRHSDGSPPAGFQYAKKLMQERFNRRQMKKLYRSGYLKREKRPLKIPGAWPDSAW